GRDLVEQRLEQMKIATIDDGDADGLAPQSARAVQPAKAAADYDYMGPFVHLWATLPSPPLPYHLLPLDRPPSTTALHHVCRKADGHDLRRARRTRCGSGWRSCRLSPPKIASAWPGVSRPRSRTRWRSRPTCRKPSRKAPRGSSRKTPSTSRSRLPGSGRVSGPGEPPRSER